MKLAKLDIILLCIALFGGLVGIASNVNPLSNYQRNGQYYPYPYPYPYPYSPPAAFSCLTVFEIPKVECEALVSLYNRTKGPAWKNQDHWLRTNTPSQWYGVYVSGGHVYGLYLTSNRLNGTIPFKLGNLPNLHWLYLDQNYLTGSIPAELGSLTNLQYLYLDNNQLTGPIPTGLGNLTKLVLLYLKGNHLTGEFPASFTKLTSLTNLNFDCWITSSNQAVIAFVENLVPGWQNNVCLKAIDLVDDPITSAASVGFIVTFSESVQGVDLTDFRLTTTGHISGASIWSVSRGTTTYTVTVKTGTGNGTIRLDVVDDDSIKDQDGNPLGGVGRGNGNFSGGLKYTIIKTYLYLPLIRR
jgi:hypothetical protein